MVGVDYIYFIQKNFLDLKARSLSIEATNETFASKVSVIERCRYYVSTLRHPLSLTMWVGYPRTSSCSSIIVSMAMPELACQAVGRGQLNRKTQVKINLDMNKGYTNKTSNVRVELTSQPTILKRHVHKT